MLKGLLINRENWDEPAVIGKARAISYGDLARKASAIRERLPQEPPKNIAIFLPNGSDYIAAFFAVIMSGLTAFPMDASMTQHEAVPLLRQTSAHTLVTSTRFQGLFEGIPGLKIICVEHVQTTKFRYAPLADMDRDAPMVLLSTSGTTGQSKIAQLSQRNVETSLLGYIDKMNFGASDRLRFVLATPFSSAYGLMILSACLRQSFPIVLTDGAFTLDTLYKTVCEHKVTNYEGGSLPIQMMARLVGRPIPYDISTLKCLGYGGSKVPGSTIDTVMNAYPGVGCFQGYGMTEASPLITKHKWARLTKFDSAGSAIKGVTIAVEADGVITQAPHTTGEILVKGPNVMLGYYNNEEETKKAIKNGYLYTGDIGYLDEDGDLYISGRKKNIIIVRGLTVYPEEVETCIAGSPLVRDCFVYGRPDGAGNEMICADVLPANPQVTAADVMGWCAARLAGYKQPRAVTICYAIRKNAAGKTERLRTGK